MKRIGLTSLLLALLLSFNMQSSGKNNVKVLEADEGEVIKEIVTTGQKKYKNVILFIGDGMGHNHINAGRAYNNGFLHMTDDHDFYQLAFSRTDSLTSSGFKYDATKSLLDPGLNEELYDGTPSPYGTESLGTSGNITLYTDSAAGGTALATGSLTTNSRLAIDEFGAPLYSLTDQAKAVGKKAGVLTSEEITGATPSAFLAHHGIRHEADKVLESMAQTPADLIIGVKPAVFDSNGTYYSDLFSDQGFHVASSINEFTKEERLLGVLPGILAQGILTPTLADLTTFSLDYLDNEEGFFLMVEGANIDKQAHANQPYLMLEELLAFDKAVNSARLWAGEREDTLIVVTADHETGALSFLDDINNLNRSNIVENMKFNSTNHSRALVRVEVSGDVSEYLEKYQTKIGEIYDKYYFDHILVNKMLRYYI